ncbi:uncharacterized protein LOC128863953 [Anastrepha ludens]|uniref:uncharacterized protein LOC128863953 n=1 Tax=Anastrepha ludens TaxID=28586 RepID=UPI0023B16198|nr:uncharacterized protein LOC128863953 [Anastrepha ludens]
MDDYAVDEDECDCLQVVDQPKPQELEKPVTNVQEPVISVEQPAEWDGKLSTSEEQLRSQPFSPLRHCIPKRSLTLPRILVPQSAFGASGGGAAGSGRSGGGRGGF